jgi:hypothetical protein
MTPRTDAMFGLAYDRLKATAPSQLGAGRHTRDATALAHELYLKVAGERAIRHRPDA